MCVLHNRSCCARQSRKLASEACNDIETTANYQLRRSQQGLWGDPQMLLDFESNRQLLRVRGITANLQLALCGTGACGHVYPKEIRLKYRKKGSERERQVSINPCSSNRVSRLLQSTIPGKRTKHVRKICYLLSGTHNPVEAGMKDWIDIAQGTSSLSF